MGLGGKKSFSISILIFLISTALFGALFEYSPLEPLLLGNTEIIRNHTQLEYSMVYDMAYFSTLEKVMANAQAVVYNRVPKCASTVTFSTLITLARKPRHPPESQHRRYYMHKSKIYDKPHLNSNATKKFVSELNNYRSPWVFERHLHFVDFSKYNVSTQPIWINVVRRPVDRFISDYYFSRYGHPKPMSFERRNRTLDECVLDNYDECNVQNTFYLTPYFCGQDELCLKPSRDALVQAMKNIDRYYAVIGLAEQIKATYELFEKTMPQYFEGMLNVYKHAAQKVMNKNNKKRAYSQQVHRILNNRCALDNELYVYIVKRFQAFLTHYGVEVSKPLNETANIPYQKISTV